VIYLIHTSTGEASLVALAFLALNDLFSASVDFVSRTMEAFDVWRTGTLRFPFGLQRVQGLAGFGLGVLGTFNGLYVLKETIEDIIISFGEESVSLEGSSGGHHHHHHYTEADPGRYIFHIHAYNRVSAGGVDVPVLLLLLSTLALMTASSSHKKANTSRMSGDYLTLLSCSLILMVPLLGIPPLHSIDRSISLSIAFSMIALGLHTGKTWGSILLCITLKDETALIKQVYSYLS
jgi:divalent metal cation (Fe/Co/Zn/Cd) transporter